MSMRKILYSWTVTGFAFGYILLTAGIIVLFSHATPVKGSYNNGYYSMTPGIIFSRNNTKIISSASPQVHESDSNYQINIPQSKLNSEYCLYVPVLMYHHIQPYNLAKERGQTSLTVDSVIFDQQMAYLVSQGYVSISADELANALKTHSALPAKPVVITMDDGYKDNFEYAFPIIQKYGLIANIMIPTGLIENFGWLNWNDLKTMVNSGRFYAYDHTWSHAALAGVSNDKIETEIMMAKQQLEDHLGKPVSIFAYPYGSKDSRVISALIGDGFSAAFSTIPGKIQCDSFIMTLHRTRIGNGALASYGL
ncbi:MAG: hypothetical protein CO135_00195 [Candidatus Levybacteria bacterium CG_4_9_14_3_um_filter_35_16]|nr:MAG: hypothetical protein COW87_01350 [Candidatus Levybacteria bacterium CG22_combo_CG10-13_8_21_14_all_35_11]PJA91638.1 MAG: hypothetical protein CO135_00195 [Candidatus Levybacteria bacterium CG_4_9_14_3_um_filter_35_16]PJC54633.1 MAG: hypothetical protein CO028_01350 [Candidatus Levybacteria bacterium CG_4_9_14_0_2_um_filter_35_21]